MSEDCDRLLADLADLLHGEVTAERRAALEDHLHACPPCFERADFQAQLRQLIARRCHEEAVPDRLRARIHARLQVEITGGDSRGPGDPS